MSENLQFDLGGCDSLSPYEEWRRRFVGNFGVSTHFAEHLEDDEEELPWCAFIGTFEDIACRVVTMEEQGEIAYGNTEREALEHLARCEGVLTLDEENFKRVQAQS